MVGLTKDVVFGLMTVLGASLIHLTFGFIYTVGNMNPYLINYMNITSSQAIFFNSAMLAAQAVFMPIGGFIARRIGWRIPTIASMVCTSGGLFISSYTVNKGLGPMIITYSLMYGMGMGLPYSPLYAVACKWFPSSGPTVIGIVAAGLGLGALVFIPIQTAIINPKNLLNSDPEVLKVIPRSFLIMGGIVLSFQIVGFLLIRERKDAVQEGARDNDAVDDKIDHDDDAVQIEDSINGDREGAVVKKVINYTTKEALHTIDFYIMLIINFLNIISVTLVSSTFKIFGGSWGFDDRFLATIGTICSAFNCVGRVFWGMSVQKFSFKCPVATLQSMWTALLLTYPFVGGAGGMAGRALYAIWTFLLFSCIAGNFALLPCVATSTFGPKYMPTTFALLFLSTAPSTLILAGIMSVFDITGQWIPVYYSGAAASFIGLILSQFLRDINGTCVSATNKLAALCDSCRTRPHEEEEEEEKEEENFKEEVVKQMEEDDMGDIDI